MGINMLDVTSQLIYKRIIRKPNDLLIMRIFIKRLRQIFQQCVP